MSSVHHFTGSQTDLIYQWEGVQPKEINTDVVKGVLKHVLVGPQDHAPNFVIRYFNVPAGAKTFYDRHPHEHGVVILHGNAQVQINDDFHNLKAMDAVFISGDDIHQFTNIGDEALGFICVIPRSAAA